MYLLHPRSIFSTCVSSPPVCSISPPYLFWLTRSKDERNRNVTFLKRKAGLMKKAYELSVLCGVSVSILVFGTNGKPYEFCSSDFDTEVDKYYDYEGTIERRRGAEFEAMALAGEDDDDEEDERPGAAKKPTVSKSLKGKESFKARRMPRSAERSDRRRHRERERDLKPAVDDSFVGALLEEDAPPPRPESPVGHLLPSLYPTVDFR